MLNNGLQLSYYMNRVKKAARLLVFVCLILLAGLGVGLSGGVPIPFFKSRRDAKKEKTELIEHQDECHVLK